MSDELQPCPFCGSCDCHMSEGLGGWYVMCWDCDARGPSEGSIDEARRLWNRRILPDEEAL